VTLVLDAGALIAVERGDRATAALIEVGRQDRRGIIVPAGVVAQTWRSRPRQARVARLLNANEVSVEPLTDAAARATGILCGASETSDVVDASVVIAARRYKATVISSDRADLVRLDPSLPIVDC
jgi:hypothetical protein